MDKGETVGTRLPPSIIEKIDKQVESSEYLTRSDWLRQAIREKIQNDGGE